MNRAAMAALAALLAGAGPTPSAAQEADQNLGTARQIVKRFAGELPEVRPRLDLAHRFGPDQIQQTLLHHWIELEKRLAAAKCFVGRVRPANVLFPVPGHPGIGAHEFRRDRHFRNLSGSSDFLRRVWLVRPRIEYLGHFPPPEIEKLATAMYLHSDLAECGQLDNVATAQHA